MGGKIKYSSDNVTNPFGKREGNSPRFPKEGGCGGKDVQDGKGRVGRTLLGEVGKGASSTKNPKGPGKRQGGNSEEQFPKENSCVSRMMRTPRSAGRISCHSRLPTLPLRGCLGHSCHLGPLLSIPALALTAGSGGAVGSSGCTPHTTAPSAQGLRFTGLPGAGKAPLDRKCGSILTQTQ